VTSLAADLGLTNIDAYTFDSTQLWQRYRRTKGTSCPSSAATNTVRQCAVQEGGYAMTASSSTPTHPAVTTVGTDAPSTSPPNLTSSQTRKHKHPRAGASSESPAEGGSRGRPEAPSSSKDDTAGDITFESDKAPPAELLALERYDYVCLDPPCSALGLRPRLQLNWTLKQLDKMAAYQRALLHSAVAMLKPGGRLLYCTCTINPGDGLNGGTSVV